MIRNINDEGAGAGAGKPKKAEPDPDLSGEGLPEADASRFDEDEEIHRDAIGDIDTGEEALAVDDDPADDDPADDDPADDHPADDDPGDPDDEPEDVVERPTAGLEAVGLDTVEGPCPRPIPAMDSPEAAATPEPVEKPHDTAELKGAVEAILFSMSEPIGIRALSDLVGSGVHEVRGVVEELRYEYVDSQRAFRLEEIAGGVQLLTQSRFDRWIGRLRQKEKESRLSAAALETLSVVAYKQPITKADLEGIRGVGCSQILKTLMDRGLLEVVGRDEGLGKPLLYGTTRRFLESFGLESVRELPRPEEFATQDDDGAA